MGAEVTAFLRAFFLDNGVFLCRVSDIARKGGGVNFFRKGRTQREAAELWWSVLSTRFDCELAGF